MIKWQWANRVKSVIGIERVLSIKSWLLQRSLMLKNGQGTGDTFGSSWNIEYLCVPDPEPDTSFPSSCPRSSERGTHISVNVSHIYFYVAWIQLFVLYTPHKEDIPRVIFYAAGCQHDLANLNALCLSEAGFLQASFPSEVYPGTCRQVLVFATWIWPRVNYFTWCSTEAKTIYFQAKGRKSSE